jgi:PKHD-type hydroxylase
MVFHAAQVLTPEEVDQIITFLKTHDYVDGKHTAGAEAQRVKRNLQLSPHAPHRRSLDALIAQALFDHPGISAFALPRYIFGLLLNKYEAGMSYGNHVDSPIMNPAGEFKRTDLSITVFLSDPATYEGGELVLETNTGAVAVKLGAGDAVVYPSYWLHRVEPVTAGVRFAAVAWMQSLVRDGQQREILFELGQVRNHLVAHNPDALETQLLTKNYYNLTRLWAEV